ncbi:MAG: hypothetical protein QXK49_01815, partial [Candidatus Aenigmatarchaeota archaeon]
INYNELISKFRGLFIFNIDVINYFDTLSKSNIYEVIKGIDLTYSETLNRLISVSKGLTSFFVLDELTRTITLFTKNLIDTMGYSEIYIRVLQFNKIITNYFYYFENNISLLATQIYHQTLSDQFSLNEIIRRSGEFSMKAFDMLNLSEILIRIRIVLINVSDFFWFNEIYSWIRTLVCSAYTNETSCALAGCFWCSGVCQATTCQAPYTPPSGGVWIPPITNITKEVKTVLDTSVHVETPEVSPGEKVYATITILKIEGPEGITNVNLSYWLKDSSGNIIAMKQTVVGIENVRSDIYYLTIPLIASPGTYAFEALAQYDNATDYSFDNFQITIKPVKPPIVIKRVDVPFILVNENITVKIIIENQENKDIDLLVSLLLPYNFEPQNITKLITLKALSEEILDFSFISKESGSFSGFIKIEFDDKKVVKDFAIEVYAPEKFINYIIRNYWWLIDLGLVALLALFLYKTKNRFKRKVIYVYRRKDLLP